MLEILTTNRVANSCSTVKRMSRLLGLVLLLLTIFVSACAVVQAYARGYKTNDNGLKPGMIVVINTTSAPGEPLVERATRESVDRAIGITTEIEDNLVTVASGEQQVYVQMAGVASAYVTDTNGGVVKGDKLTLSPLKGILMRGNEVDPIVATALEDFPDGAAQAQPVTGESGATTARLAKLNVALENSLVTDQEGPSDESAIERLGRAVIGRDVGELQVIVALIIFFIVLVSEGSIIYGAVSSGIISIGRNPMAKDVIRRELIRVLGLALVVLLIGLGAIYLVLRI